MNICEASKDKEIVYKGDAVSFKGEPYSFFEGGGFRGLKEDTEDELVFHIVGFKKGKGDFIKGAGFKEFIEGGT